MNVESGEVERVTVGALVDVVLAGKYKDHLIVRQHKYFLAGGSYDWYWLVNVDGSEVGPIGPDEESLKQFSEMYVRSGPLISDEGKSSNSTVPADAGLWPARLIGKRSDGINPYTYTAKRYAYPYTTGRR